ncbi:hypothetical protein L1887_12344 [Cichorium endivia]|nr:hypothetical protein L1887_12344 [Cichorium endivia]
MMDRIVLYHRILQKSQISYFMASEMCLMTRLEKKKPISFSRPMLYRFLPIYRRPPSPLPQLPTDVSPPPPSPRFAFRPCSRFLIHYPKNEETPKKPLVGG